MGARNIEVHADHSFAAKLVHLGARVALKPLMTHTPLNPVTHHVTLPMLDVVAKHATRKNKQLAYSTLRGEGWTAELVSPVFSGPKLVDSDGSTLPRRQRKNTKAIAYFHGGAFMACGVGTHRRIVEQLALHTGVPVMSVNYRQFPKGTVDVSLSDCVSATKALAKRLNTKTKNILVAGDSAGGYLSMATALHFRDEGSTVAGVVSLSGWLDLGGMSHQVHRNARKDAYIPAKRLARISSIVLGRAAQDADSLIHRNLTGLPPVLLICAAGEVLRHDTEAMATSLRKAGVVVHAHAYTGQVHAFPVLATLLPESRAALRNIAEFAHNTWHGLAVTQEMTAL